MKLMVYVVYDMYKRNAEPIAVFALEEEAKSYVKGTDFTYKAYLVK